MKSDRMIDFVLEAAFRVRAPRPSGDAGPGAEE
jgi:hypothetical protein